MISIINNPNSTVAYFKQENCNELISGGLNKRALEKGGVKTLLQELGYGEEEILYGETGQPYFKERSESFLSISHAKGWFAVIIGTGPVGIDIQTKSSRLKQGRDYFLNEYELSFSEDEVALQLIWGAKEAFYKLKSGQIPDLKEEVRVVSISNELLVIDFESTKHELKYLLVENAFLVFTV
nr:4'-phosphopantetheinyl transferase superfamily protein [uncultured Fluviicola sp.]